MVIPEEHKRTIKALVEADPEVALATCDIPHLDTSVFLREVFDEDGVEALPYCGCFLGVYGWMQECKRGNKPPKNSTPRAIYEATNIDWNNLADFACWCITVERDHKAVRYARGLLEEMNG